MHVVQMTFRCRSRHGQENLLLVQLPPGDMPCLPPPPSLLPPNAQRQFDVVCTCFFSDCLPDTLMGLLAVRDALRPGGIWVGCLLGRSSIIIGLGYASREYRIKNATPCDDRW